MLILLLLRVAFNKKDVDPESLFQDGFLWYDQNNGAGQAFGDNALLRTNGRFFDLCTDREYGPDRPIVALAPTGNSYVNDIKASLDSDLASYGLTARIYDSRQAIMDILESSDYEKDDNPGICFGAAFVESDDTNNRYQVNMIFDDIIGENSDSNMPNQELDAVDQYQREPNDDAFEKYNLGGYSYLQNIISNSILRGRTGSAGAYISMINAQVKSSEHTKDDFIQAAEGLLNFFILLIFLAPLYRFVSNTVTEKETKMKEAMKIMGLTDLPYWLSWFTYYTIINTIQ